MAISGLGALGHLGVQMAKAMVRQALSAEVGPDDLGSRALK